MLARDTAMVRLLMAHGADARIGIYPHRVPTTPLAIATERGYDDIAAIIREAEATTRTRESPLRIGDRCLRRRRNSWPRSMAATNGR